MISETTLYDINNPMTPESAKKIAFQIIDNNVNNVMLITMNIATLLAANKLDDDLPLRREIFNYYTLSLQIMYRHLTAVHQEISGKTGGKDEKTTSNI